MERKCSFLWLLMFISNILQSTNASIAGVTYMGNFDFQERYRDVNVCNPFYWHPLHLPEECTQMFDTLIRSRLQSFSPYRIYRQEAKQVELTYPSLIDTFIESPIYVPEVRPPSPVLLPLPPPPPPPPPSTPFEILFDLLRRDIQENPSAPTVAASPYFGSVAMYKQPVSFKSVRMIKKLARAYANAYPAFNTNTETITLEEDDYEKFKKKNKINQKT